MELSEKVCDSAERLRDTLVHELCHAAVWLLDGVWRGGHGREWKSWGRHVTSVFPYLPPLGRCHSYQIHAKFVYQCTACQAQIRRHSKSVDTDAKVCGRCGGRLLLFTQRKDAALQPHEPRKPNVFALYVKQHYRHVKQDAASHKEAMTLLSQRFHAAKLASTSTSS